MKTKNIKTIFEDKVWINSDAIRRLKHFGEEFKVKHAGETMTVTLENIRKLHPKKGKEVYHDKITRKPYTLTGIDWKPDPEIQKSMF